MDLQKLNSKGIVVVGNDHLGHGFTANSVEELGYFYENEGSKIVMDDLYEITKEFKNTRYVSNCGRRRASWSIRKKCSKEL